MSESMAKTAQWKTVAKVELVLLALLVALSGYNVVVHGWLRSLTAGIWLDESSSIFFTSLSWSELGYILVNYEANMAVYYALTKIFVLGLFGESEVAFRLLPFLFYLGAGGLIFAFLRSKFDIKVAAIFAALVGGHYFLTRYAVEIRAYSFTSLMLVIIWLCWLKAVISGRSRWWFVYAAAGAIGLYAHFFVALGIFTLGMLALAFRLQKRELLSWLVAHGVIVLFFIPIVLLAMGRDEGLLTWIEVPQPRALIDALFMYAGAAPESGAWLRRGQLALFVALCGFAGWRAWRGQGRVAERDLSKAIFMSTLLIAAVPVVLIYLISLYSPIFSLRFFVPFAPFPLIAIAIALGYQPGGWNRSYLAMIIIVVMVVMMVVSSYQYAHRYSQSWKTDIASNMAQCHGREAVLFMSPTIQSVYNFYQSDLVSDCQRDILPYRLNGQNYLFPPSKYPSNLGDLSKFDRVWIFEAHVIPAQQEIKESYLRQISEEVGNCRVFLSSPFLTLSRCDAVVDD